MIENKWKKISIRGRLAYATICLENGFNKQNIKGVEKDFILKIIWQFTSSENFDEWEKRATEILPLNLLDAKFNISDFEILSKDQIVGLQNFYKKLPGHIIELIDNTLEIGLTNLYGSTKEYSDLTLNSVIKVIANCIENNIETPNIEPFSHYYFDTDFGWGQLFTREEIIEKLF